MAARGFAYDLAGHLTGASIPGFSHSWAYDAAGRPTGRGGNWVTSYVWDGAGNLANITYTDGSVFTYSYDALNRTTAALQGATTLAALTYDPLGRRSALTFNDGSSQTYAYDLADRPTSIAHAFPASADNVSLGYAYDNAGRELNRTTSNPAYAYSPPVGASVPYASANALNQYPSVNSYPFIWSPQGPLATSDQFALYYDELNDLTFAYVTPTPGVIDPNNWANKAFDALGHAFLHQRHLTAGQPYPSIYPSTDGLRPETVLEWQYLVAADGLSSVFQGYRRYVLGPNPDERWAFLDMDGATYFPHADREGTAIALSKAGAAVRKFHYGAYGESADPAVDQGPTPDSYLYRYTGQRLDPGTGLYDYKARDYSTALGSGLIDHSQNMMVAAMQMADMKVWAQRS